MDNLTFEAKSTIVKLGGEEVGIIEFDPDCDAIAFKQTEPVLGLTSSELREIAEEIDKLK